MMLGKFQKEAYDFSRAKLLWYGGGGQETESAGDSGQEEAGDEEAGELSRPPHHARDPPGQQGNFQVCVCAGEEY